MSLCSRAGKFRFEFKALSLPCCELVSVMIGPPLFVSSEPEWRSAHKQRKCEYSGSSGDRAPSSLIFRSFFSSISALSARWNQTLASLSGFNDRLSQTIHTTVTSLSFKRPDMVCSVPTLKSMYTSPTFNLFASILRFSRVREPAVPHALEKLDSVPEQKRFNYKSHLILQ